MLIFHLDIPIYLKTFFFKISKSSKINVMTNESELLDKNL